MFFKIDGQVINTDLISSVRENRKYPHRRRIGAKMSAGVKLTPEEVVKYDEYETGTVVLLNTNPSSFIELEVSTDTFYKYFRKALSLDAIWYNADSAIDTESDYRPPTSVGAEYLAGVLSIGTT